MVQCLVGRWGDGLAGIGRKPLRAWPAEAADPQDASFRSISATVAAHSASDRKSMADPRLRRVFLGMKRWGGTTKATEAIDLPPPGFPGINPRMTFDSAG
jgi:hypothetical protein